MCQALPRRACREQSCRRSSTGEIIKDKSPHLSNNDSNVFITASLEERTGRVAARENISEKESLQKIKRVDRERAAYYNQFSDKKWEAASTYDICINTGRLGIEGAASAILCSLQSMGKINADILNID